MNQEKREAFEAELRSYVGKAIGPPFVGRDAVNLPMILATLYRAWRRDWERHRRLARWTFPIWLYVSVTGVLVYLALYQWNPAPG